MAVPIQPLCAKIFNHRVDIISGLIIFAISDFSAFSGNVVFLLHLLHSTVRPIKS